ncbi:MAG: anaerobic sulfatase maturase [Clostridium sp.]
MINNKEFFLLIKPASSDCNLKCSYCFYLDKKDLYLEQSCHRISEEVLDKLISSYLERDQKQYNISWQGGEPSLMGTEFFKKVTELEMKYGQKGKFMANAFQTNGTLITDELAKHLKKFRFLVGVSLDGNAEMHDYYRKTIDNRGSHTDVMNGIDILDKNNVKYNILTLVNSSNVKKGKELYNYFKKEGFSYQQYTPCVEFDKEGNILEFTITAKEWGAFLSEIFDEWLKTDVNKVSIRLFDSILSSLIYKKNNICSMEDNCSKYFVVEHNGDVYPCDFFVEEKRKLGNIMDNTWDELLSKDEYILFGKEKSRWNNKCNRCSYLNLCLGDCLKHRYKEGKDAKELSYLCEGWKMFYKHSLPRFKKLASSYGSIKIN